MCGDRLSISACRTPDAGSRSERKYNRRKPQKKLSSKRPLLAALQSTQSLSAYGIPATDGAGLARARDRFPTSSAECYPYAKSQTQTWRSPAIGFATKAPGASLPAEEK